jgi:hypothetical protein
MFYKYSFLTTQRTQFVTVRNTSQYRVGNYCELLCVFVVIMGNTNCVIVSLVVLIQGDQKVSVHLMITIQKVTRNVRSVYRQSPDIC